MECATENDAGHSSGPLSDGVKIEPGDAMCSNGNTEEQKTDSSVKVEPCDTAGTDCDMKESGNSEQTNTREACSQPTDVDNIKQETDEFEYTKRNEFTSEIFKIQIQNLPRKFGFAELKKKFIQLEMKPVKMKVWKDMCFVTFRCEEERTAALQKVNGLKWRGCDLKATPAQPVADPLLKKRRQDEDNERSNKKSRQEDDGLTPTERLRNSVTPLWQMPYEEQLKSKEEEMRMFLKKLHRQIEKNCPDLRRWLVEKKKQYGFIPCDLQSIIPSPITEGYRNKCEFTIGPGLEGDGVVGFRYGKYEQGTVCVGSPDDIIFLPDLMKSAVQAIQAYIRSSSYSTYNPENHTGHWRQLAVRTSRLDHLMIMIDFHPQNLSQDELDTEVSQLREYFTSGEGKQCPITSCYFRSHNEKITGGAYESCPYIHVFGEKHITEELLGMKFQISPSAFFQVNTQAAEVLYTTVSDWCNVTPDSTVLDVCCGTGTIGLSVAKNVKKVIGIEMCEQAIEDAKVNAQLNNISNVTYHCAKAEDVMKDITKSVLGSTDVIAIVDPPRGGLHSSVVVAIRNCRSINKLVYVSCNVNGALSNLVDLVRPTSKRLKGERFYPVKAVPVDLFPHTKHCELVILFERNTNNGEKDDQQ